jgi:hypothetical protein
VCASDLGDRAVTGLQTLSRKAWVSFSLSTFFARVPFLERPGAPFGGFQFLERIESFVDMLLVSAL